MEIDDYINQTFLTLEHTGKVNPYAINDLSTILFETDILITEVDRLCFLIVSDLCDNQPLITLQANNHKILWYDYIRLQLYCFLRGHGEYQNNHILITAGSAIIIENITKDVLLKFAVETELIPLIISMLICVIAKVSVNAWCEHFYNEVVKENPLLHELLKELETST